MAIDRRVLTAGGALVAFVAVVHVLTQVAPAGSAAIAADVALPLVEAVALALTGVAFARNRRSPYRWTWLLLGLWLAANLFADAAWGWYELVEKAEPPVPSPADILYLISYPLAFATVVFAAWRAAGRLRALEGALDSMMFAIAAAGIAWPFLLAPLLASSEPGWQHLINFAYPLGDLLVIVALASLLLGSFPKPPPRFLKLVWAAFLIQVVADSLYFYRVADGGTYQSGGLPDSLWLLVYAVVGTAAVMGIFERQGATAKREAPQTLPPDRPTQSRPSYARMLVPYLALPLLAAMLWVQFTWYDTRREGDGDGIVYLGVALVMLLVVRQFVTLVDNRRLTTGLSDLSQELGDRVEVLADLTGRLEELNARATQLNCLEGLDDVMRVGLDLACSVTKSPAAWMTLAKDDGSEPVAAVRGSGDGIPDVGSTSGPPPVSGHRIQQVTLEARGEKIGTLWLLRPAGRDEGPDLVQAIGAQLATAVDNTQRYEQALRLAERDPLTGLLNHRGIHERLATEGRRAHERRQMLSLVMIDLDDFKLLNDTYGHPMGDKVLRQVSDEIRGVLRHSDLAGRVGGDEMMLVLPETDHDGAMRLAERLREVVASRPFVTGKEMEIPLRLSFGVATYPTNAESVARLVAMADESLYASKQRGGDTITGAGVQEEAPAEGHGLRGIAGRLMDAVGARDHYTRRHSDQVVVHALHLGEALGLAQESLETLRLSAMLHDVGKLGVRPALLRKPGPLTGEEESAVRRHVDIGETIIRDLPRVAAVLEVVQAHHERHDGQGYPLGLSGDDIPLLARILAIADAYAAMVVTRPYRRKLSREQARAELLKGAGAQLDPELVSRFLETLERSEGSPKLAVAG